MALDLERNQALFHKMDQILSKTRARPLPERVHQVRTTARRLEALIETLCPAPRSPEKKLLRRLARLRRRAGRVRDLDVQMAALRTLKITRGSERQAQLLDALAEMRRRREQQFTAELEKDNVRKLRKKLRQAASALLPSPVPGAEGRTAPSTLSAAAAALQPIPLALQMFARLCRRRPAFTEQNLHAYRTACKRVRYVAEMAGDDPQTRQIVELLKRIQDEAGEWHDWLTLTQSAEALLSPSIASPLISALRNITKAKFVHALNVVRDSRRELLALHRAQVKLALPPAPPAPVPAARPAAPAPRQPAVQARRKPVAPALLAASGAA